MEDWFIKQVLSVASNATEQSVRDSIVRHRCLFYRDINKAYQYSEGAWFVMIGDCRARHERLDKAIALAEDKFEKHLVSLTDPNT